MIRSEVGLTASSEPVLETSATRESPRATRATSPACTPEELDIFSFLVIWRSFRIVRFSFGAHHNKMK